MRISRDQLLAEMVQLEHRYAELEKEIASEAAKQGGEPQAYQRLGKELSDLRVIVMAYRTYGRIEREVAEAESLFHAKGELEIRELARDETRLLRQQQAELYEEIERLWCERNQVPERPIIVEIRAGTGGLEASLFVGDLFRMYTKYADRCGLDIEEMQGQPSEAGGLKEVAFSVKGPSAWQRFKNESGVHRVQRIPETEAQGRRHTSTATVAVLPEPEDVELPPIPQKDLQVDVYRSSGPGGQGVNTTDSAVRIKHLPTGLIVTCQDERSQMRNKEKAMRVLRARLLDRVERTKQSEIASDRRKQVGTGERSEKIRTYNFLDRRVTDHRIGLTLHKLDEIMDGDLEEFVSALAASEEKSAARKSK